MKKVCSGTGGPLTTRRAPLALPARFLNDGEMSADRSQHSRPGGPADTPTFSLVVISRGDADTLHGVLAGLFPLCDAHGVQTVVIRAGPVDDALALEEAHSGVCFLRAPGGAADGALRAAGMAAADGDVVLLGADDDPALRERLLHLLRSHGVLAPGAGDPIAERSPPAGERPQPQADGDRPASRQDLTSRDAPEASACQARPHRHPAPWTGSPRATAPSSSVPVPAG